MLAATAMPTLGQVVVDLKARLRACSATPKLDAELLVCHVLQISRSRLRGFPEQPAESRFIDEIQLLAKKRSDGVPIAYLTGQQEFWSLPLRITPDVLVPRPETELLVELALQITPTPCRILDLGTGSGAIALALARELPDAQVLGIDQSLPAVMLARDNAANLGIRNVHFQQGDWMIGLPKRHFDLVVGNPPYIAEGDAHLNGDGVRHEPQVALVSGTDGLTALREIIRQCPAHLSPGAQLLLEHGADQGPAVRNLLQANDLEAVITHKDFAGLDRVSAGRLPT